MQEVITYYLEMLEPSDLRPARPIERPFEVRRAGIPYPALNRFLYQEVGAAYQWIDRLSWSEERWLTYLDRPALQTWLGYVSGTPAGYFELEAQEQGNVELAYFGLLPPFLGQGIGGALLTAAIERAWAMDARRVWVHTCSLDHPAALRNYQARGFRLYDEKRHIQTIRTPEVQL
ncbi:MAG: GNAT family N-acetyltransferase [Caldilineaceae bacterium]|nr:GNAT family N-acetyltransferase [Caldilineaceae bacterium]